MIYMQRSVELQVESNCAPTVSRRDFLLFSIQSWLLHVESLNQLKGVPGGAPTLYLCSQLHHSTLN